MGVCWHVTSGGWNALLSTVNIAYWFVYFSLTNSQTRIHDFACGRPAPQYRSLAEKLTQPSLVL